MREICEPRLKKAAFAQQTPTQQLFHKKALCPIFDEELHTQL